MEQAAAEVAAVIQTILDGFYQSLGNLDLSNAALLQRVPSQLTATSLWVELMHISKYECVFSDRFAEDDDDDGVAKAYARKPAWAFGVYVAAPQVEAIYPFLDPAGPQSIRRRLELDILADPDLFGPIEAQVVCKEGRILQEWQQMKIPGQYAYAANFPLGVVVVEFM